MLKSEAERIITKFADEYKAEFTDEQKTALAMAMINIASTIVEEALNNVPTNRGGGKPQFFA
ncbi:MAG: hypothetical protein IT342_25785 [Candidatus Melainabacteria bacterium]|jgi:hypothetical protein|nr:hypothetical protein [Candidatus Melainabacteria bacterium]